jgi:hypothetical protein
MPDGTIVYEPNADQGKNQIFSLSPLTLSVLNDIQNSSYSDVDYEDIESKVLYDQNTGEILYDITTGEMLYCSDRN